MLIKESLANQEAMSSVEKQLSDYFLNDTSEIKELTARQLANDLYVSPSTVTRFCQRLGFSGLPEFKEALITERLYLAHNVQDIDVNQPFLPSDSIWSVANNIRQLYTEVVADTLSLQDYQQLESATKKLGDAQHIYVYSAGDHRHLAEIFANKMLRIGRPITQLSRTDLVDFYLQESVANDVVVLISYSGETQDIHRLMTIIDNRKLQVIALTAYGKNTLSEHADILLPMSTRERLIQNFGNFSTDVSVSYLLDILYASYLSRHVEANQTKMRIEKEYQRYRFTENPIIKDQS